MIRKLLLVALAVAGALTASAQQFTPDQKIPADPAVRVGKLDNGMTYYIRHNAKPEKQGEFFIFHNVGAIQEEDSQMGLAHFLEHMAFNGTKNLPDNMLLNYLETIGVKFGQNLNAGTGQDMTVYNISSVPLTREGIIDSALLILHDWSHFITLDPKEIDKERGVIVEELRTGNTANFRVSRKTDPIYYNNSRYAYRDIIGHEEQLRTFSHQELIDFYNRWYRPDLQAIVLVGDFDVDTMEAKLRKLMSDIPAVKNPEPKVSYPIPGNEEPLIAVATDPELMSSSVTYFIKREPMPFEINDTYMVTMLSTINSMTATMGNYRLLEITQKPNAPFVSAYYVQGRAAATMDVFMANLTARDGETTKAFEALYTEVERIRRYGFTESELERVKAEMMRSAEQQYDNRNDRRNNEFVWSYINNFYNNNAMPSAEVKWQTDSTLISSLDLMSVNMYVTKGLLTDMNEVVIVKSPEKEGVIVPSVEDIRATMALVKGSDISAPEGDIEKKPLIDHELKGGKITKTEEGLFANTIWTLSNGAKVSLKHTDFKADEIIMKASAHGGLSILSDDDYASGESMSQVMHFSGIGNFPATELMKQLAGKSANVNIWTNNYENGISGNASVKDFETMLQLVYLYFTSPRFSQDDFDMMVDKYQTILSNSASDPQYIFANQASNTMYANNIRRQQMSLERIKLMKFDRMEPIFRKLYNNAGDFFFSFVGNISPEQAMPLIEKYIGSLPASKAKLAKVDDKVRIVAGEVTNRFEVAMQAPKNTILFVHSGELDYNPENITYMSVLSQILQIRYTESIREEKGGTYGVGVAGRMSDFPGERYSLIIQFDTDPKMADELMEIVSHELSSMAANGPKAEDVGKVKEFMIKQRQDDLKKNNVWQNYISSYYVNGIDLNSSLDKLIDELSGDKIKALVSKIVADGNLVRVIMDPKAAE